MKEIIIDGVNVAECGFLCWKHNGNELIENYCSIFNNKCICNPDCYFKQLQRLKQKNEELRNNWRLDCLKCEYKNTKADVVKYKQALEEIKNLAELEVMLDKNSKAFYPTNIQRILDVINEVLNEK